MCSIRYSMSLFRWEESTNQLLDDFYNGEDKHGYVAKVQVTEAA